MNHIINKGSAFGAQAKRLAHAVIVSVFTLTVTVSSSYVLLNPSVAQAATVGPTNVQAITGGNSIALMWDLSTSSVANYKVYRNSTEVATVTPGQGVLDAYKKGNRYIDTNVVGGTTYQYQVKAVGTDGTESPLTTAVSATHPTAANTTPVPTVTVDTTGAPDLADLTTNHLKPEIEIWYPKMADAFARPDYTPRSDMTIWVGEFTHPSGPVNGDANANTGLIRMTPSYLRDTPGPTGGTIVHEAHHILVGVLQNGWMMEGTADYAKEYFLRERSPRTSKPNDQLSEAYTVGSFFLNWVRANKDANFIRKAHIAQHNGTNTDAEINTFFQNELGKTADALFAEMQDQYFASAAPVVGIGTKCVETLGTVADGVDVKIAPCNGSNLQQWNVLFNDVVNHSTTAGFQIGNSTLHANTNYCLTITSVAENAKVNQWNCKFDGIWPEGEWKTGANGSLINPKSNKCLTTAGGASTDGTLLAIATCNGSAAQNWTVWYTNSGIDKRYASDQTFRTALGRPTVAETTSGIFTYKGYSNGRAYYTTRSGVREVHGPIWTKYNAAGAHTNYGEPTTDQMPTPNGLGQFNHFYGAGTTGTSSIYWTSTTGAQLIFGAIRSEWGATGWEAGPHGFPTTSEAPTPNGLGKFNSFQNGGIYWTASTGAKSVRGAIAVKWGNHGWEGGFLGFPVTSETATPSGIGRFNQFQGGFIFWSPSTGAWEVHGAIQARWSALGWEQSYLGYPTSDEFNIAGGKRSNFQHGYITWNASNGVVTDRPY